MSYIIANISKSEYLRPEAFGDAGTLMDIVNSYQGVMAALTALLADSNGRGSGDMDGQHPAVGSWAGDRIIIIDERERLPDFGGPEMAGVPVQDQLRSTGSDISGEAFEAVLLADGGDSRLASLNPRHVLSFVQQTKLQDDGATAILHKEGRAQRLSYTEDLLSIFGESLPLTTKGRERALEAGINKMAHMFHRPERYRVSGYATIKGMKRVRALDAYDYDQKSQNFEGDKSISFDVTNPAGTIRTIVVTLGSDDGTKVSDLYDELFPGIEFERPPQESGYPSEVAKLLSFLTKRGE